MAILDNHSSIPDKTKEACAVETMCHMLKQYAEDTGMKFTDVLVLFSSSTTYGVLFDFETGVWKEGPDYLRSLFEKDLVKQQSQEQPHRITNITKEANSL